MPTFAVSAVGGAATPVWYGNPLHPVPFTLSNLSATANLYVGYTESVGPSNIPASTEVTPGGYLSYDGTEPVYYAVADAANAQVQILPGVTSFFLPASLVSLGGISAFVQPTAPTQPPTIPLNSVWLNTTLGAFETWNGSSWNIQAFTGTELITAGTIAANLFVAGIVQAGIVNGTEIDAAIFRAKNSFGATILTVNKTSGTWFLYTDTGSATQGALSASAVAASANVSDEFGNLAIGPGLTTYGLAVTGTWIAANFGVSNSAFGVLFYTATSEAGPWSLDSWLRRSGSTAGQLEEGPIVEFLATSLLPPTPATGSKLWVPNTSNTLRVMKADGEPGYGIGETHYVLPALQTISAGWAVPLAAGGTSLSVPVVSGQQYYFEATFYVQNPTASTNVDLGVTGPTVSQCNWWARWGVGTTNPFTASLSQQALGALTFFTVDLPATANSIGIAHAWGTFTPSANGTLSAGAGEANSIAFSVLPGTLLKVRTVH